MRLPSSWFPRLHGGESRDKGAIPARLVAAIREQQDLSERLIGWI